MMREELYSQGNYLYKITLAISPMEEKSMKSNHPKAAQREGGEG